MDTVLKTEKRPFWKQPAVWLGAAGWLGALAIIVLFDGRSDVQLSGGGLANELIGQAMSMLFALLLVGITVLITRRRPAVSWSERTASRAQTRIETAAFWGYLAVGLLIGSQLGLGLHLHGTIFGPRRVVAISEVWAWTAFNFVYFAVIPYLVFRYLGYSNRQMGLLSGNRKADVLLIVVILVIESIGELTGVSAAIFDLTLRQFLLGGALSFGLHLFGTGLPVMVSIYAILMPRYVQLTGSSVAAAVLGGLSYAIFHLTEFWAVYDSPINTLVSAAFVFSQFFGPGLVKSALTVTTGNAWVHVWAYHAIAPHVTLDTPLIVRFFRL
ncbi:MAG: hypothetical protein QNJ45_27685 [Ardenticatenaceae bacterium]|nr:hypothetical protein [Ardenticatenaceae bacterium]